MALSCAGGGPGNKDLRPSPRPRIKDLAAVKELIRTFRLESDHRFGWPAWPDRVVPSGADLMPFQGEGLHLLVRHFNLALVSLPVEAGLDAQAGLRPRSPDTGQQQRQ